MLGYVLYSFIAVIVIMTAMNVFVYLTRETKSKKKYKHTFFLIYKK